MIRNKRFLFTIFFVALLLELFAQQLPQFSQGALNKFTYNPAYGGLERSLNIISTYRTQYTSILGNPKVFNVSADMPYYVWHGGIGFNFYHEKSGALSNENLKFSYNYVQSAFGGLLSFGGRIGIDRISFDYSEIVTPDGDYQNGVFHNDPILPLDFNSGIGMTYELGAYFMSNTIQGGFVIADVPNINQFGKNSIYQKAWYVNMFAEYTFRNVQDLLIKPSILVKVNKNVIQSDVCVMAEHIGGLYGGLSWRGYSSSSFDALIFIMGGKISDNIKLTYSYDMGTSELKTVQEGSHEFSLAIRLSSDFGRKVLPPVIYNTRDL